MISATWWTNSAIYIPEYSQYWFQHAALNLITKSSEFTLLQYSTTLSSLITSFCIIFDICNMINYRFIYIPEYSQFWFHHAALNLITTRREFTLLQYSTTLSSLITSFCIIFDICNMINYRFIYIPEYSQFWFHHAALNLITTRREFTLLQYSTTLSSLITSFCIIFDICNMINYRIIYIPEYSQYWFQHAVLNLITTRREFTLLQYSTTLSSLITSFCIIFDICNMINYRFIYIPEYSQFWFHHAALNLITTRREFTLLQYSTTLSCIITSFCIIFDICNMMNQQYYIYSRILPVLISTCCIEFNHYKTWIYSITVFYNTLMHNRIILYHIWYLQHDEQTVLYIFQNTPSFDFIMLHWIYSLQDVNSLYYSILQHSHA